MLTCARDRKATSLNRVHNSSGQLKGCNSCSEVGQLTTALRVQNIGLSCCMAATAKSHIQLQCALAHQAYSVPATCEADVILAGLTQMTVQPEISGPLLHHVF